MKEKHRKEAVQSVIVLLGQLKKGSLGRIPGNKDRVLQIAIEALTERDKDDLRDWMIEKLRQ